MKEEEEEREDMLKKVNKNLKKKVKLVQRTNSIFYLEMVKIQSLSQRKI